MAPSHPRIIFGGANIGVAYRTSEHVEQLLKTVKASGIDEIDTASLYPWSNIGMSESLLGRAGAGEQGFKIDTKILVMTEDGNGTLETANIHASVNTSNERLQLGANTKLNVLHCHAPDFTTPLEEQAAALDALHKKGLFQQLGVVQFPLELLVELIELCQRKGYVQPTVYQGCYNLVQRECEALFPILRKLGMIFNAHSPLATGFLTGKFTSGNFAGTSFDGDGLTATALKERYKSPKLHDAMRILDNILRPTGISNVEAALRWISYHSQLTTDDGIIIGASKPQFLQENMEAIRRGPLPEQIVTAMSQLWDTIAG